MTYLAAQWGLFATEGASGSIPMPRFTAAQWGLFGTQAQAAASAPAGRFPAGHWELFGTQSQAAAMTPSVSDILAYAGPTTGGTIITVLGSNLSGTIAVHFGSTPASSFANDSATEITAVAPVGVVGVVDITVTTAQGTSPVVAGDEFTYYAAAPHFTAAQWGLFSTPVAVASAAPSSRFPASQWGLFSTRPTGAASTATARFPASQWAAFSTPVTAAPPAPYSVYSPLLLLLSSDTYSTISTMNYATAYVIPDFPAAPVVGETYAITLVLNGVASVPGVVTPAAESGVAWGSPASITAGATFGTLTLTFTAAGVYSPAVSHTGLGFGGDPSLSAVTATAAAASHAAHGGQSRRGR